MHTQTNSSASVPLAMQIDTQYGSERHTLSKDFHRIASSLHNQLVNASWQS